MAMSLRGLRGLTLPDLDAPDAPPAEIPAPPTIEELLEAARREGHAAGLREGEARGRAAEQASRDAMAEEAIRIALSQLDGARAAAREAADRNAEALAGMLAWMVDTALPGAAAREAAPLLDPLMRALGPLEDAPPGAVLRVPPALLDHARDRYGATGLPIEADPALPEGDARIAWRQGGIDLDLSRRRAAIREALTALRLPISPIAEDDA
jgi:flagellar biosynthesis/type III secretory pathway protein FliH